MVSDGGHENNNEDEPPEAGERRGDAEKVKNDGGQEGVHWCPPVDSTDTVMLER